MINDINNDIKLMMIKWWSDSNDNDNEMMK